MLLAYTKSGKYKCVCLRCKKIDELYMYEIDQDGKIKDLGLFLKKAESDKK